MRSYSCCKPNTSEIRNFEKTSKLLKLLSDESRLRILCMLRQGEHCVCEIEEYLDLSQSLISHHLRDLKDYSILENERRGLRIYYWLSGKGKKITDMIFNLV